MKTIEMTHTPGPWEIHRRKKFSFDIDAPNGDTQTGAVSWEALATVSGDEDAPATNQAKGEANARLIAAAPDMLEALLEIYSIPEGFSNDMREVADRAIAKATGQGESE